MRGACGSVIVFLLGREGLGAIVVDLAPGRSHFDVLGLDEFIE